MTTRFTKLLVANRGEIAIRVMRAANELGLRTVAIYSEEDRGSLHRYKADESYCVGRGLSPLKAYLNIPEIVALAVEKGCDAIHPGYGFLSENANFAAKCRDAGIAFVGPTPEVMERAGDKIQARELAKAAGVPCVPGLSESIDAARAVAFAEEHGMPVVLKAAGGGGGRGIRVCRTIEEIPRRLDESRREAEAAFGRADVYIERYIENPKHIEVQILADTHGNIVHLYERDCSVQRRHQKVIEVAPAVGLPEDVCAAITDAAVRIAREANYVNAGTVEFLYEPASGSFFFIEVNARIQVEHTVTEAITGIDLVKAQIRIAEGASLDDDYDIQITGQGSIPKRGVAIQCRITTEDPANNFLPDHGRVTTYRSAAGHGVRLDAGSVYAGAVVTPYYDSMLVKVTAWGHRLSEAASRMKRALSEFRIRGVKTNIPFLLNVLNHEDFLSGDTRTTFIDSHPELFKLKRTRDRAGRLLNFLGELTVNGNPLAKNRERPAKLTRPRPPQVTKVAGDDALKTRRLLDTLGAKGVSQWMLEQQRLLITDTTFRDAHQSLLATRVRTLDGMPGLRAMSQAVPGIFSYEVWGGATFDVALRFLHECPWTRLEEMRETLPDTLLQMLLRASNAVGYTNYPDNVVQRFVKESAQRGIDLFRVFDSLNWVEGMRVASDAVLESGKLLESSICYTGDIEDASRSKYSLQYYVDLAGQLKDLGSHILAIKDMAGLLKPFAARTLVKAIKDATGLPVHLHTHDTSGIQSATLVTAAEAGVDAVDCALASMSGLTSQPNLNSLVAAFTFHERATGLNLPALNEVSRYWEEVREMYAPFESDLRAGTATVYEHEIPGGQYTNLRFQAESMGLKERWREVLETYRDANLLLGDLVKVTPSSKVVGDLTLFMVTNHLTKDDVVEKAETLSFPESVISFLRGDIGQPPGGFPEPLRTRALRGEASLSGRPGADLAPVNWDALASELEAKNGAAGRDVDVLSYALYPKVTLDFLKHQREFFGSGLIPTPIFLYGCREFEELEVEIEPGKVFYIELVSVSKPDPEGYRTLVFELNGQPREVRVRDRSATSETKERAKANRENAMHLGSPMPGVVSKVLVKEGESVKKGQPLLVIEAMKMETTVASPSECSIESLYVKEGDQIDPDDLLLVMG